MSLFTELPDLAALRALPGDTYRDQRMTEKDVLRILDLCGSLWFHSGDPTHPHAAFTSDRCSDDYVNMSTALKYPNVCEMLAWQAVLAFREVCPDLKVDWVIGSSYSSITLSFMVARALGAMHGHTEKGPGGQQLWLRHQVEPGEVVLRVEELVTTRKTLTAVRTGILEGNRADVTFAPVSIAVVNRSNNHEFDGKPLLNVAHFNMKSWDRSECPLCIAGCPRLRPRSNWKALTLPDG